MKKILIIIILVFGMFITFNISAFAITTSNDLTANNVTYEIKNSHLIISGTLTTTSSYDGSIEYAVSFKSLKDKFNFTYSNVSLSLVTTYYEDTQETDLSGYEEMQENLRYVGGIEAFIFMSTDNYEEDVDLDFKVDYTLTNTIEIKEDITSLISIYRYSNFQSQHDLACYGKISVQSGSAAAKIDGSIAFNTTSKYEAGWYYFDCQGLCEYSKLNCKVSTCSFTLSDKQVQSQLNGSVIVFKDNNAVFFYLPQTQNNITMIQFTMMLGAFQSAVREINNLYKLKLIKLGNDLSQVKPVVESKIYRYATEVDDPVELANIVNALDLHAFDNSDGDITDKINVTTSSSYESDVLQKQVKERVLGSYEFDVSVKDTAKNEAKGKIAINVVDTTAPTVLETTPKSVDVEYNGTPLTDSDFTSKLQVTDNYSTEFTYSVDLSTYLSNKSKIGQYTVKTTVKDKSGNGTVYNFKANVIDKTPPVFTGVNVFNKSTSSDISAMEIAKACITNVHDEICGDVTYFIYEDNYTLNSDKVGSYSIVLRALDNYNNVGSFTITVAITDSEKPYLYISKDVIEVTPTALLSTEDIYLSYMSCGLISSDYKMDGVIEDNYSENYQTEGIYSYTFKVNNESDDTKLIYLSIKVEDDKNTEESIPKVSWFTRIFNKVTSIFNKYIFKNLMNLLSIKRLK